jgi:hypothetical protein
MEDSDGPRRGVRVAELKNPAGLYALVLIDRCLDISYFDYKGASMVWKSTTGDRSPFLYESRGSEWLRSFFGGLLCTCGLSYMGAACIDNQEELGLHGRISNSPAYDISTGGEWDKDDYIFWLEGKVREATLNGDNLELRRKITMSMDGLWIKVNDLITNIGNRISPLMVLYHMNFGFPLLDAGSKLIEFKSEVVPQDDEAEKYFDTYNLFENPQPNFKQRVYYHDICADHQGYSHIILANERFNNKNGIGVHLKFRKNTLPYMTEWKNLKVKEYALGLEPGNSYPRGRVIERSKGNLRYIEPNEEVDFEFLVEVIPSNVDIKKKHDQILDCYS